MENEKTEYLSDDEAFDVIEETEEVKTEVKKPKWSLKKKLLVGGGVVLGLVLGAIALGSKNKTTAEQLTDASETPEGNDEEETDTDEEKESESESTAE